MKVRVIEQNKTHGPSCLHDSCILGFLRSDDGNLLASVFFFFEGTFYAATVIREKQRKLPKVEASYMVIDKPLLNYHLARLVRDKLNKLPTEEQPHVVFGIEEENGPKEEERAKDQEGT